MPSLVGSEMCIRDSGCGRTRSGTKPRLVGASGQAPRRHHYVRGRRLTHRDGTRWSPAEASERNPRSLLVRHGAVDARACCTGHKNQHQDSWHRRMGHINAKSLDLLNKTDGNVIRFVGEGSGCDVYITGKSNPRAHPKKPTTTSAILLSWSSPTSWCPSYIQRWEASNK